MKIKTAGCLSFLFISFAGIFFFSATTHANDIVHFEAYFKQQRIPLKSNTTLKADSFGFSYSEITGLPLRLEINLGRLTTSHKNNVTATGFSPDGYYGGLSLVGSSAFRQRLQFGWRLSYTYHSAEQTFNQERLEITWQRSEAKLWAGLQINQRILFYGCGKYADISGEQLFTGNTVSRIDIEADKKLGYCGGLRAAMPDNGFISLEADGGLQRGGTISFGKRF